MQGQTGENAPMSDQDGRERVRSRDVGNGLVHKGLARCVESGCCPAGRYSGQLRVGLGVRAAALTRRKRGFEASAAMHEQSPDADVVHLYRETFSSVQRLSRKCTSRRTRQLSTARSDLGIKPARQRIDKSTVGKLCCLFNLRTCSIGSSIRDCESTSAVSKLACTTEAERID